MIIFLFTDGSRDGNYVACATGFQTIISMRLPDSASIFTAEIWATIKMCLFKVSQKKHYLLLGT